MQIIVGMAWYERDDYPRILEIMEDAEKLPRTYDEWKQRAELGESQMRAAGRRVVRAIIKPEEFVAWCATNGHNVDTNGRTAFASAEAASNARTQ